MHLAQSGTKQTYALNPGADTALFTTTSEQWPQNNDKNKRQFDFPTLDRRDKTF